MPVSLLRTICVAFVLALALPAATATAQTVYRSVDAQGNVTYSDKPPANAVNVKDVSVQPGPSDAAQSEARERAQRDEAKANEMREAREHRVEQQQPQAAQPGAPVPPAPVAREDPVEYYQPYQDPYTAQRDQIRNRPERPPVQLPERPVQLPARPAPR